MLESVWRDLRQSTRAVFRQPSFTVIAAITLALAIGVNTVIFSLVNFFVLLPLPVRDEDTLARLFMTHPDRGAERLPVSYADFADWENASTPFVSLAALARRSYNLTGSGEPLRVRGALVSSGLFAQWGLDVAAGRGFVSTEHRPGAERVALLSHGFWTRRFGADPALIGRTLRLNGEPHTVIGVLTPRIEVGTLSEIDLWTPLEPEADPLARDRRELAVTGRLAPGIDFAQAAASMEVVALQQQRAHPETNRGWTVWVTPFRSAIAGGDSWVVLTLLSVAVAFVLALACANVANLMLARGIARKREVAVRTALGASRSRIVRRMLTESSIPAILGGGGGLLLAAWGLDLIRTVTYEPFFELVTIDPPVLAFSVLISVLTPLLFGLLPALRASRSDVATDLKEGAGRFGGARRDRGERSTLVVLQLALAVSLLIIAGLAIREAVALRSLKLGFDTHDLITLRIDLPAKKYPSSERIGDFCDALIGKLQTAAQVSAAGVADGVPLLDPASTTALEVEGTEKNPSNVSPWAARLAVTPGFFRALGIPILGGRPFSDIDGTTAQPVAIVSESFVRRYMAGRDPLGRRIRLGGRLPSASDWLTIVGVADDVQNTLPEEPPLPQVYVPFRQAREHAVVVFVHSSQTRAVVDAARREVARLDPDLAIYDSRTMEEAIHMALAGNRLVVGLFAVFAVVGLAIAAVGLYGVISYAVGQRTQEIGIRMALGADSKDVARMVFRQAARLIATGLALGLAVGFALALAMESSLYGVRPGDPLTFGVVTGVLSLVALLAGWAPTRRATRLDPVQALRSE